jgi:hypothetical protein
MSRCCRAPFRTFRADRFALVSRRNFRYRSSGYLLIRSFSVLRLNGTVRPVMVSIAQASSRGVIRQNWSGESRSTPRPNPMACFQGTASCVRLAERGCDQVCCDPHRGLQATTNRHGPDVVIAQCVACAA